MSVFSSALSGRDVEITPSTSHCVGFRRSSGVQGEGGRSQASRYPNARCAVGFMGASAPTGTTIHDKLSVLEKSGLLMWSREAVFCERPARKSLKEWKGEPSVGLGVIPLSRGICPGMAWICTSL